MENHQSFERITASDRPLYGPRALLVAGMEPAQHAKILSLLRDNALDDVPVVFVSDELQHRTLKELLEHPLQAEKGNPSSLRLACVMSGFSEKELHGWMTAYREAELPRPLWATVTPTSETWTVEKLIKELAAEATALES